MATKSESKQVVGFFPGVWDFCHAGHCLALAKAKEKCDFLIVGLQTDPSTDREDKNEPIMSVAERLIMLESNKNVDTVILYTTETELKELDKTLVVDIRFMGSDHKKDKKYPTKAKIVYISRDHNYSTSDLRQRVCLARKEVESKK